MALPREASRFRFPVEPAPLQPNPHSAERLATSALSEEVVSKRYGAKRYSTQVSNMKTRTKTMLGLAALGLVDTVIPVPIIGIVLIYVLYQKPDWFKVLVSEIYGR